MVDADELVTKMEEVKKRLEEYYQDSFYGFVKKINYLISEFCRDGEDCRYKEAKYNIEEAMRYLEKTINWLDSAVDSLRK